MAVLCCCTFSVGPFRVIFSARVASFLTDLESNMFSLLRGAQWKWWSGRWQPGLVGRRSASWPLYMNFFVLLLRWAFSWQFPTCKDVFIAVFFISFPPICSTSYAYQILTFLRLPSHSSYLLFLISSFNFGTTADSSLGDHSVWRYGLDQGVRSLGFNHKVRMNIY